MLSRLGLVSVASSLVPLYNLLYVRHAIAAQFESVSVEDFLQFMASKEAFIDKA